MTATATVRELNYSALKFSVIRIKLKINRSSLSKITLDMILNLIFVCWNLCAPLFPRNTCPLFKFIDHLYNWKKIKIIYIEESVQNKLNITSDGCLNCKQKFYGSAR